MEKVSFEPLSAIGAMLGVHAVQNALASKFIINRDGGKKIVKDIVDAQPNKKISSSIKRGLMNVIVPEKGILNSHVGHKLDEISKIPYRDRAIIYTSAKGDFGKIVNGKAITKSKSAREYLKKNGVPIDMIIAASKVNPHAVKEFENIHKNSPIGKMTSGIADASKLLPKGKEISIKTSLLSEGLGNAALAMVEPGAAVMNIGKRYLASEVGNNAVKLKVRDFLNRNYIKKNIDNATQQGFAGKMLPKPKSEMNRYVGNAVVQAASDYSNKMALKAREVMQNNIKDR